MMAVQHLPDAGQAPRVLVVGSDAAARARIAALVWRALPAARVEELSGVSDLMFRVAGNGIELILLDTRAAGPCPSALVPMLKALEPRLRLATLATAAPVALEGLDAALTEAELEDWLRQPSRSWR